MPQNVIPEPADNTYRVFARDFDLIVDGDELARTPGTLIEVLRSATPWEIEDAAAIREAQRVAEQHLASMTAQLRAELTPWQLQDTVVTLLLDHSGSMRGKRALIVADFAEACTDALSDVGVAVEVLGFTTRSWKGGLSRDRWMAQGRPKFPGRLCDVLHVVHRQARSTQKRPHHFAAMRLHALYKENIDGEALQWAAERSALLPQRVKVLIVVSDGAPVDDSTLSVNAGNVLELHLLKVRADIEGERKIALGGIGIDYAVWRYYSTNASATPVETLGAVAPPFIAQLIIAASCGA